jgi:hypothetical protein
MNDPRRREYYLGRVSMMEKAVNIDAYVRVVGAGRGFEHYAESEYRQWRKLGTEQYIEQEIMKATKHHTEMISARRDEIAQVATETGHEQTVVAAILAAYFDLFGEMDCNTEGRGDELREAGLLELDC